ncbi:HEAT repeat domain-containing protein [Streptomyces sp. NPDC001108]
MTRDADGFSPSPLPDSTVRVVHTWADDPALAAHRLDGLLRAATPAELMRLESGYRGRHYGLGFLGGVSSSEDLTGDGTVPGNHALAVAALMSFDRSGYLREAGVARLAQAPEEDSFPVPFLLLRLNDPVGHVRDLARDAVTARLGAGHVGLLVELLPFLDKLRGRHRAGRLLTVVEDLLLRSGTQAMWEGVRSGDAPLRASCLRRLARTDPVPAVTAAFATRDPALWQWAARTATSKRLAPADQDAVLPCLEHSSSPRIRLRGLRARARRADGEPHLRRAMLDKDARVRYHSRAALYALGHTDLAPQVYRDALKAASPPDAVLIGALGGLSDLGTADDVPRVVDLLAHPRVLVRAEAWRTLGILDPREPERRAALLTGDPGGRVRRHLPARPNGVGATEA